MLQVVALSLLCEMIGFEPRFVLFYSNSLQM